MTFFREEVRWSKFEENWEERGDKWSKPHVVSLPQLRKRLENGKIMMMRFLENEFIVGMTFFYKLPS